MTPKDLAALHKISFQTPRPWTAEEFAGLLEHENTVLISDKHGFALGRILGVEAELLTLAIDPTARRQGHASRLIAELSNHLRSKDVDEIILEVSIDNEGAKALYSHLGFLKAGVRKAYYKTPTGDFIDGLVLRKEI